MRKCHFFGLIIIFAIIALQLPFASAVTDEQYHLKLLAVEEGSNGEMHGTDADIFLEVRPGRGRVFLDTHPATKMDTQISTRYAKDIACEISHVDCSQYDFTYTIQARTSIIGGPSAGAAVSALTAIALMDLPYSDDVAVTGTINSGGIVGPVGGVKEKIEAASDVGLSKVLISRGSANHSEFSNSTNSSVYLDLVQYGAENLSVTVVEVTSLQDVIFHLTGENITHADVLVSKNEQYTQIMASVREDLCTRSLELNASYFTLPLEYRNKEIGLSVELTQSNLSNSTELLSTNSTSVKINESFDVKSSSTPKTFEEQITERFNKSMMASRASNDYSAASFCFGINIELQNKLLEYENLSADELVARFSDLSMNVTLFENELGNRSIATISDLQTKMIVEERLNDVSNTLVSSDKNSRLLAYAIERFETARIWQSFFVMEGEDISLDPVLISSACNAKLAEAQERIQYTELFLPPAMVSGIREKIGFAAAARDKGLFSLCLSIASQAKADSNAVLTSIGLSETSVRDFIASKQRAVEQIIATESAEGRFPILGYSYYEYAKTLSATDPFTSLVYMEYALELSDLSLYFPSSSGFIYGGMVRLSDTLGSRELYAVMAGFGLGVILTVLVYMLLQYRKFKREERQRYRWKK